MGRMGAFGAAALASVVVTLAGCGGGGTEMVDIDGSSTVFQISEEVAVNFRDEHPEIRVSIGQGGTGTGMKKFTAGEIDICDASVAISPEDAKKCDEAGFGFVEFPVAYDGISIVVNKNNTWCKSLTVDQLKELWRPDSPIKKWSDIDPSWPDKEIRLWGPGPDSGTFDYFTEEIVGEKKKCRTDYSPNEDDNILVSGVQNDEYALAYFGYSYYAANKDTLNLLGVDAGDGTPVQPSAETIRDNSYKPLSRPLFIYVNKKSMERPAVAKFVEYYVNSAAKAAESVAYVPLSDDDTAANVAKLAEVKPAGEKL